MQHTSQLSITNVAEIPPPTKMKLVIFDKSIEELGKYEGIYILNGTNNGYPTWIHERSKLYVYRDQSTARWKVGDDIEFNDTKVMIQSLPGEVEYPHKLSVWLNNGRKEISVTFEDWSEN